MNARDRRSPIPGVIIILTIAAMGLLVFFVDALHRSMRGSFRFAAVFAEAPELRPGAEVWIAGRAVGRVRQVGFLPLSSDTFARVVALVEVPQAYRELVRRDSRVRLAAPSPIGDRVVDIRPGTPTAPRLAPGDTLRAEGATSADRVRAHVTVLRTEIVGLAAEARPLARAAAARAPDVGRVLAGLESAVAEVRALEQAFGSGALGSFMNDGHATAALARAAARTDTVRALLGERLAGRDAEAGLAPALSALAARADSVVGRLTALRRELEGRAGFLPRVAADSALVTRLRAARLELDSLIAETRRAPARVFF